MTKPSIFRQAIDDGHGSVNVGYLALFWAMVVWSLVSLIIAGVGYLAVLSAGPGERAAIIASIGTSEGYAAFGFATVCGAIGFYLWGDARTPPPRAGGPLQTTVTGTP
jgi:hypothetical protein